MCGTSRKRRKMDERNPNYKHEDENPMDEDAPKVSPKGSPMDQSSSPPAMRMRDTKIAPKVG
jgi:hypothetical protein